MGTAFETARECAIVGLQWGDEGKGKLVDRVAGAYDYVVRYNGGANAGHSVQVGQQRYALHLIPSGVLGETTINVIGNGVVVDPGQLIEEIDTLEARGIPVGRNLRVSDRAHVVLPYHQREDELLEAALAHLRGDAHVIGTTGRGIGPCYADKARRSTAVRVADLLDPDAIAEKLPYVVALKNRTLAALAETAGIAFEPYDADELVARCRRFGERLAPHVRDTGALLREARAAGARILHEGANATLLDIDHGTYPYVSSSNCSALGIHAGAATPGPALEQVVGVVKAYTTRVGGGPMPTELEDETGAAIRDAGNEYGTTTGRPRRCGWLDLVATRYAARVSGVTHLGLTLLDVLADFPALRICVNYRHRGELLEAFPADPRVLADAEPVYEQLEGFPGPLSDCRQWAELPSAARAYVERIEAHVGVPVAFISVGPQRAQTIVRPSTSAVSAGATE